MAGASIVIAQLSDQDGVLRRPVHDPVFVIDATRPIAGESVLERLGLADSGKRIAPDLLDETDDAFEPPPVGPYPVLVILPGVLRKDELHLAS